MDAWIWALVLTPLGVILFDLLVVGLSALIVRFLPPKLSHLLVRDLLKR